MLLLVVIVLIAFFLIPREGFQTSPAPNSSGGSVASGHTDTDVWPAPIYNCSHWDAMYPTDEFRGAAYCVDQTSAPGRCTKQKDGACPKNFTTSRIGDIIREVKFQLLGTKDAPTVCQGSVPVAHYSPMLVNTAEECQTKCISTSGCRGFDTTDRKKQLQCNLFQGSITSAVGTSGKGCFQRM